MNTGRKVYEQAVQASVRLPCNFMRLGVIIPFHETAMAWFAHD
jgi:hypothetical protein